MSEVATALDSFLYLLDPAVARARLAVEAWRTAGGEEGELQRVNAGDSLFTSPRALDGAWWKRRRVVEGVPRKRAVDVVRRLRPAAVHVRSIGARSSQGEIARLRAQLAKLTAVGDGSAAVVHVYVTQVGEPPREVAIVTEATVRGE